MVIWQELLLLLFLLAYTASGWVIAGAISASLARERADKDKRDL